MLCRRSPPHVVPLQNCPRSSEAEHRHGKEIEREREDVTSGRMSGMQRVGCGHPEKHVGVKTRQTYRISDVVFEI